MKFVNPFAKKQSHLGFDVGSHWAKVVRLAPGRGAVTLDRVGRMPFKPETLEKPEKTAQAVKELWRTLGLTDKVAVSSMAGHAVIIKRVSFPAASDKELEQTIRKEARQYIPFDIQDVFMDFQVMGAGLKDGTVDVLLVASKKKVVQELQATLGLAGIGLTIMDVDAFALSNCFEYNYPELLDQASYLLDIGGQQSIFCVYHGRQPVFFREVGVGGQQITDNLARVLNLKKSEAEAIKLNGGESLTPEQRTDAVQTIQDTLRSWTGELKRLIGFYQGSTPGAQLSKKLFLAGGGSMLTGLPGLMKEELGLEVEYLDPWRKIDKDPARFDEKFLQEYGPHFAIAMGLALRTTVRG